MATPEPPDPRRALDRIADALERLAPPAPPSPALLAAHDAFLWHGGSGTLEAFAVAAAPPERLAGIDRARDLVLANTRRFAAGHPANNVLLWGARGMGKSSLVKAAHLAVLRARPRGLALVEIAPDELSTLPRLLGLARAAPERRIVLFCDDLSFDAGAADHRGLKSVLEGGIAGRPDNVVLYATSNRRHLMPRDAIENERSTALHAGEAVEEKVSLSDRFGLSIGFHAAGQEDYLEMVRRHAASYGLHVASERLAAEALEWAVGRGARSGRVAAQFAADLAGRLAEEARAPD